MLGIGANVKYVERKLQEEIGNKIWEITLKRILRDYPLNANSVEKASGLDMYYVVMFLNIAIIGRKSRGINLISFL